MTARWLSLVAAVVVVLTLCTVGFGYAASRADTVRADSAVWQAQAYEIGTPYAGVVQSVSVGPGSHVLAGQELFRVQSPTLQQAMARIDFADGQVGYRIEKHGVMVFTAAKAGVVQEPQVSGGQFVEADDKLATIAIDGSLTIKAEFTLTDRDYAKLPARTTIDVIAPGGTTVVADVYYSKVEDSPTAHTVRTTMLARAPAASLQTTVTDGAPTTARLDLIGKGRVAWASEQLGRLFQPGGFRR